MINSKQHAVQNSGPWDPWLPVVENSRLFAQRTQHTVRPLRKYLAADVRSTLTLFLTLG